MSDHCNVPHSLIREYFDSDLMHDIFTHCEISGKSQMEALVLCVKALHYRNKELMADSMKLQNLRNMLELFDETGYLIKLPLLKEMVK